MGEEKNQTNINPISSYFWSMLFRNIFCEKKREKTKRLKLRLNKKKNSIFEYDEILIQKKL